MWHECECEGDCLQKTTHAWSRWATAEENPISCHSAQLCPTGNSGYNSQTIGKMWLVWEVSISDATFENGINVQIIPSPQWPHLYAWDVLEQEIWSRICSQLICRNGGKLPCQQLHTIGPKSLRNKFLPRITLFSEKRRSGIKQSVTIWTIWWVCIRCDKLTKQKLLQLGKKTF